MPFVPRISDPDRSVNRVSGVDRVAANLLTSRSSFGLASIFLLVPRTYIVQI
jgi:hypothetical protein